MMLTAWPAISQTAAAIDSVKISFLDAQSAALELEEKDRLEVEVRTLRLLSISYQSENIELELQRGAFKTQIELLQRINKTQKTQNEAQKAKGANRIGVIEILIGAGLFIFGVLIGG